LVSAFGDLRGHCRISNMTKWGVRIQSADDWGDVPMAVRGSMEEDVSPNCCASVTSSADAWIPASSSEKAIPPLQKSHHACSTNCRCRLGGGRKACAISPAWAGAVSRTCKTIESPGARSALAGTHALDWIFPKKRGTQKIRLGPERFPPPDACMIQRNRAHQERRSPQGHCQPGVSPKGPCRPM